MRANKLEKKTEILIVCSDLLVGGTERQVSLLAAELKKTGTPITVYSFVDGDVRSQLERDGVKVIVPGKLGLIHPSWVKSAFCILLSSAHLFWTMVTRRPSVAHFFLPAAYLIGAPMAMLARVPVRVMSRRSLNYYFRRYRPIQAIERWLHRSMHAVLGNSRGVVDQLVAEGVPPDRLGLIYNGIDHSMFTSVRTRDDNRRHLGLSLDMLVTCIVANLIPYKGHRDLIDALGVAAPNLPPDWRLLVIGRDDGIGQELQDRAKRLGLQDHIVFIGPRTDVAAILIASDIGILCSHEEGFSNAILEGMAAGLPMIVTDVGGNAEAVIDGQNGLVVPVQDIQRLAAAIVRLAGDAALRTRCGAAGRQRVIEHFGLQKFVQSHHKLYQALLKGESTSDVADVGVTPTVRATIQA